MTIKPTNFIELKSSMFHSLKFKTFPTTFISTINWDNILLNFPSQNLCVFKQLSHEMPISLALVGCNNKTKDVNNSDL